MSLETIRRLNNLFNVFDEKELLGEEELLDVFEKIKAFSKEDRPIWGENCLVRKGVSSKEGMVFIYYIPGAYKENIELIYKNGTEDSSFIVLKAKNDYLCSDEESNSDDLIYYSISNFKMGIGTSSMNYVSKLDFDNIKAEFVSGVLKVVIPFKEDDILYKSNKIEIK